ncbi:hypothetical protein NDU88_003179, partial [Pleurodeles waltl]
MKTKFLLNENIKIQGEYSEEIEGVQQIAGDREVRSSLAPMVWALLVASTEPQISAEPASPGTVPAPAPSPGRGQAAAPTPREPPSGR